MSDLVKCINYEQIAHMMDHLQTDIMPAQLQGVAYAFVSLKGQHSEKIWAKFLLDEFEDILDNPQWTAFLEILGDIFRSAQSSLNADDFNVSLCLPEDDAPLSIRLEALGAWCRGFMYGLGLADKPEVLNEPDIQEALNDLSALSNIASDSDDSEQDEVDFHELVEYVRLIPVMIYQHQHHATELRDQTIH